MVVAAEQDQRSIARAKSRWRYAILVAAILAFSASLLVGLLRLLDENEKASKISKELIYWSASQLSLEYWRFLSSLGQYGTGGAGVTKDDLKTRLDILWSRIGVYDGGVVGGELANVNGATEIVANLSDALDSVEADVQALEPADTQTFERIYGALNAHAYPVFQLAQRTNLYEQGIAIEFRQTTRRTFWVLTAFLLGIVATGGVLIVLLIFETRSATHLLGTARGSEQRAREGEANIRAIVGTAADAIITTDARGTILSFNPAAESMFGYEAADAMGRDVSMFIPGPLRHAHHKKMRNYLQGDADAGPRLIGRIRELEALRRDGSTFPIELSLGVTDGQDGATHVAFVRDITARKQEQEQIHHSQKMDALGELTGGVAHEFNNLLTAISGFSEMARRDPGNADQVDYCLTEVVNASSQAAELTKQMLAFARKQELDPRVVKVGDIIESVRSMLRPLIGPDINLTLDTGGESAFAKVDPSQLKTAVMNLAINACHAMPGGGELSIRTWVVEADERLASRISVDQGARYVALSARDTGTGIEKDVLDRIFEPFFTTKEEGKGTGLGLAMVHGMAEQAGGFVDVESTVGAGTEFTIYLPLCAEPQAEAKARAFGPPGRGAAEGCTILVAEDREPVRELARATLEKAGYEVLTAENGEMAAEIYRERNGKVDLLLTDVIMPKKEGPELALELLADNPNLRVVYMSGFISEGQAMREIIGKTGVFIQKPFDPDDLVRVVSELVLGAADGQENAA